MYDNTHFAKAKKTKKSKKRITLKQYLLLVELGMDGEIIMKWTSSQASDKISALLAKKQENS